MNFFIPFLILFVLEILTFGAVADAIGGFATLLLVILAAIGGMALVKRQGTEAIALVRGSLHDGKFPSSAVFERFCMVIAGLLFIVPGFLTDILGLVLLIPRARSLLQTTLEKDNAQTPRTVLEGEYETVDSKEFIKED